MLASFKNAYHHSMCVKYHWTLNSPPKAWPLQFTNQAFHEEHFICWQQLTHSIPQCTFNSGSICTSHWSTRPQPGSKPYEYVHSKSYAQSCLLIHSPRHASIQQLTKCISHFKNRRFLFWSVVNYQCFVSIYFKPNCFPKFSVCT